MTPQPKPPLLLLGSGYTGRSLMAEASRQGRSADATSRDPDRQLADISPTQRVRFDLAQPDMWVDIPMGADIIWCFPATPLEHVQAFAGTLSASSRRLVVLGSTSAYEVSDHSAEYPLRPGLTNQPRSTKQAARAASEVLLCRNGCSAAC